MRSRKPDLRTCKKLAPAPTGVEAGAARGREHGAHNETMKQRINLSTNQPTNESTNETTKRIFGSMFAKARRPLRKRRPINTLRQMLPYPKRLESHKKLQDRVANRRKTSVRMPFRTLCKGLPQSGIMGVYPEYLEALHAAYFFAGGQPGRPRFIHQSRIELAGIQPPGPGRSPGSTRAGFGAAQVPGYLH